MDKNWPITNIKNLCFVLCKRFHQYWSNCIQMCFTISLSFYLAKMQYFVTILDTAIARCLPSGECAEKWFFVCTGRIPLLARSFFTIFGPDRFLALKPQGLHTTAREPKRAYSRVPAFKNTTKIQQKDPQEREERKKFPAGEKKKTRNFGWSGGGPEEGALPRRGVRGPKILKTPTKNLEDTHQKSWRQPPKILKTPTKNLEHTTHTQPTTHTTTAHTQQQQQQQNNQGRLRFNRRGASTPLWGSWSMFSPKQAAQPNPSYPAPCRQDTTSAWSTDYGGNSWTLIQTPARKNWKKYKKKEKKKLFLRKMKKWKNEKH